MNKILAVIIVPFLLLNFSAQAQDEVFTIVEIMPEYPGGLDSLYAFLGQNLQYPIEAKNTGIQGTVYVSFIVEKNGSITSIKVIRGIGAGCDEEAIRVVSKMPNWAPGTQRGKAVRVRFNLPITYKLDKKTKKNKKAKKQKNN